MLAKTTWASKANRLAPGSGLGARPVVRREQAIERGAGVKGLMIQHRAAATDDVQKADLSLEESGDGNFQPRDTVLIRGGLTF